MLNFDDIKSECESYIEMLRQGKKGCFLIRAYGKEPFEIRLFESALSNRKPKDIPQNYHDAINDYFFPIYGWKVRNGVFSYGAKGNLTGITSSYGITYLLFPCGNFKYVYDPDVYDLLGKLSEFDIQGEDRIVSFVKSINYLNTGLGNVMQSNLHDGKSAEIIINCTRYYLVNLKYSAMLTNYIWS